MKTTFEYLIKVFQVSDDRQIRVNLRGKIHIIDPETVIVKNRTLAKLLKSLEGDTILNLEQASSMYKITQARLQYLGNKGYVPFFKLAPGKKGSRMLFQKSELDAFFSTDIRYFPPMRSLEKKRDLELTVINAVLHDHPEYRDLMIDYYVKMMSVEEISRQEEKVPQTISWRMQAATRFFTKTFERIISDQKELIKCREEYSKLYDLACVYQDELNKLRVRLEEKPVEMTVEAARMLLLSARIDSFKHELSTRLYNVLIHDMSCVTLNDIVKIREVDIRKYRNVGMKTVSELNQFLKERGLSLSN